MLKTNVDVSINLFFSIGVDIYLPIVFAEVSSKITVSWQYEHNQQEWETAIFLYAQLAARVVHIPLGV